MSDGCLGEVSCRRMLANLVHISLVLMLTSLFHLVCSQSFAASCPDLHPHEVFAAEGDELRLNCSLATCNATSVGNRSSIHLRWRNTSAVIGWASLTFTDDTVVFLKAKVELSDDGKVKCGSGNMWSDATVIHVLRRPLKPKIDGCVLINWERLVCSWSPSVEAQRTHTRTKNMLSTSLSWKTRGSDWTSCPRPLDDSCMLDVVTASVDVLDEICLRVNVTSQFLRASNVSNVTCVRPNDLVKPNPPTSLGHVTVNSTRSTIRWSKAGSRYQGNASVVYRVMVALPFDKNVATYDSADNEITIDTVPNSIYNVTIIAKSTGSVYWSESSEIYSMRTPATVPCRQPVVAPSVCRSLQPDHVQLYWKPVAHRDECGPGFHYRLVTQASSDEWISIDKNISASSNTASLPMSIVRNRSLTTGDDSNLVAVAVSAWNDLGQGGRQRDSAVLISTRREIDNSGDVIAEGDRHSARVRYVTSAVVTSLTVYWCIDGLPRYTCAGGPINWMTVDVGQLAEPVSIPLDTAADQYQIGISALLEVVGEGQSSTVVDTGIQWAECVFDIDGPVDPVTDVKPMATSEDQVHVTWSGPACRRGSGRIVDFLIQYCAFDNSTSNQTCYGSVSEVRVPSAVKAGTRHSYTIDKLKPDTSYRITVLSCSSKFCSGSSNIAVAITAKLGMRTGLIVGLGFLGILFLFSVCAATWIVARYMKRLRHFVDTGIVITTPDPFRAENEEMTQVSEVYNSLLRPRQTLDVSSWKRADSTSDSGVYCADEAQTPTTIDTTMSALLSPDTPLSSTGYRTSSTLPSSTGSEPDPTPRRTQGRGIQFGFDQYVGVQPGMLVPRDRKQGTYHRLVGDETDRAPDRIDQYVGVQPEMLVPRDRKQDTYRRFAEYEPDSEPGRIDQYVGVQPEMLVPRDRFLTTGDDDVFRVSYVSHGDVARHLPVDRATDVTAEPEVTTTTTMMTSPTTLSPSSTWRSSAESWTSYQPLSAIASPSNYLDDRASPCAWNGLVPVDAAVVFDDPPGPPPPAPTNSRTPSAGSYPGPQTDWNASATLSARSPSCDLKGCAHGVEVAASELTSILKNSSRADDGYVTLEQSGLVTTGAIR